MLIALMILLVCLFTSKCTSERKSDVIYISSFYSFEIIQIWYEQATFQHVFDAADIETVWNPMEFEKTFSP